MCGSSPIRDFYAFILIEPDNTETLVGFVDPDGQWLPLMAASDSSTTAAHFEIFAQNMANASGKVVQLVRMPANGADPAVVTTKRPERRPECSPS